MLEVLYLTSGNNLCILFTMKNIVSQYSEKAKLLMIDTDSLVYLLETADVYNDRTSYLDAYDTSD